MTTNKDESQENSSRPEKQSVELGEALSSDKGRTQIEKAKKIMAESERDASSNEIEEAKTEVNNAADSLTSAVDKMTPPLLLSIGMLDTALRWLKVITTFLIIAFCIAAFIAFRTEKAAKINEVAAKEVANSRVELAKANKELAEIKESLMNLKVDAAKQAVDQVSQPRIVAGDRPGEVSIITPAIRPEVIEKAKEAAAKAVKEGKEPPPLPKADATKIPAQLKPGEVEKLGDGYQPKSSALVVQDKKP